MLIDGRHLDLADFGLSTCADFALSPDEIALTRHARSHDVVYAMTRLTHRLVTTYGDPTFVDDPVARNAAVRACADGAVLPGLPAAVTAMLRRYARVAVVVNEFYAELFTVRRDVPFPAERVDRELSHLELREPRC